jgi:hypothetical protein
LIYGKFVIYFYPHNTFFHSSCHFLIIFTTKQAYSRGLIFLCDCSELYLMNVRSIQGENSPSVSLLINIGIRICCVCTCDRKSHVCCNTYIVCISNRKVMFLGWNKHALFHRFVYLAFLAILNNFSVIWWRPDFIGWRENPDTLNNVFGERPPTFVSLIFGTVVRCTLT